MENRATSSTIHGAPPPDRSLPQFVQSLHADETSKRSPGECSPARILLSLHPPLRNITMLAMVAVPALALVLGTAMPPMYSAASMTAPRALVLANTNDLGYQTEAAGAKEIVRQFEFADDIMMLRVAARRCAEEKDLESQRTLMLQCAKVQNSIQKQMEELNSKEADLKSLARLVDSVMKSGDKVFGSDFSASLNELQRKLD
eukprot:6206750-Pleurochrysis_carterae.AAC.1